MSWEREFPRKVKYISLALLADQMYDSLNVHGVCCDSDKSSPLSRSIEFFEIAKKALSFNTTIGLENGVILLSYFIEYSKSHNNELNGYGKEKIISLIDSYIEDLNKLRNGELNNKEDRDRLIGFFNYLSKFAKTKAKTGSPITLEGIL